VLGWTARVTPAGESMRRRRNRSPNSGERVGPCAGRQRANLVDHRLPVVPGVGGHPEQRLGQHAPDHLDASQVVALQPCRRAAGSARSSAVPPPVTIALADRGPAGGERSLGARSFLLELRDRWRAPHVDHGQGCSRGLAKRSRSTSMVGVLRRPLELGPGSGPGARRPASAVPAPFDQDGRVLGDHPRGAPKPKSRA